MLVDANGESKISADLIKTLPRLPPASLRAADIDYCGLYIWWKNDTNDIPSYIGIALSKAGLRQRLIKQHLNKAYLERREEKLARSIVYHDASGKPYCEKSVFRKKVAEKYKLRGGEECVDFIVHNFTVSFLMWGSCNESTIRRVEKEMIGFCHPELNTAHMRARTTQGSSIRGNGSAAY